MNLSAIRPRPFRAAAVQTLAALGELDINIETARRAVNAAVAASAELVVLPECMNTGYLFDDAEQCREIAERLDGKYVSFLSELAADHRIHLASGMTELGADGRSVFNSAVLLGPGGDLIAHYQKQFLATHDQNWFSVGTTRYPVVDTELGRLGLMICFDGRIPEITRMLAVSGADVVLDIANFFAMDQADLWVPARAYENGVWIVAATKVGNERSIHYPGGAMIVTPDGTVLDRVNTGIHGAAIASIDPSRARDKRWPGRGGDKLLDRRPSAYTALLDGYFETPAAALEREPVLPAKAVTKAAAVQVHALDREGSLDDALDMVEHAALLGIQLMVLPQAFAFPSVSPDEGEVRSRAGVQDNARVRIQDITARSRCVVVFPTVEATEFGVVHRAVVLGPDGELGSQCQVHREPSLGRGPEGEGLSAIETPVGRIGVLVGYDGMFPESARVLALDGAEILAWCSAWDDERARQLLAVPKAEDNRCYLVCANRTDTGFPGGSFVVDPTGLPSSDVGRVIPPDARHGAVISRFAHLSLTRPKEIMPGVHVLANRRTECYGPLIDGSAPALSD